MPRGPLLAFDELPTHARHLVALGALTVRTLHAAWPANDPRATEGVALVDDADLHLDAAARRGVVPALRDALPAMQWILATSSPEIALPCDAGDILALRRLPASDEVQLYEGDLAVVH
jgi:predicted ATP-binding protein involved in virulence